MVHVGPFVGIAVLIVVLAAFAPGVAGAGRTPPAPSSGGALPTPSASAPPPIGPPPPPPAPCNGSGSGFSGSLSVVIGGQTISNASASPLPAGYAPALVNFSLELFGGSFNWSYNISFGDGYSTAGRLVASFPGNSSGSVYANVSHTYVLPAIYDPLAYANFTCGSSGGAMALAGIPLSIAGPAGYSPVSASVNATSGPVPLAVQYTANVTDAPANATIVWFLSWGLGYIVRTNTTELNLTLDTPGQYVGEVQVLYPGSTLVYGEALLPVVTVSPVVNVDVTESNVTGEFGPGPISITFSANVTNLNGTPYQGAGNVTWNFSSFWSQGNFSLFTVSGPTVGPLVTETFTPAPTAHNLVLGFPATASFVAPAGPTLGWNSTLVLLDWSNQSGGTGVNLTFSANPTNGTAPFNTTLTVAAYPTLPSNASGLYTLYLCVGPRANGSGGNQSSCSAFQQNVTNWSGAPLQIPVTGLGAGVYFASAAVGLPTPPNSTVIVAVAGLWLSVVPSGSGGPPSLVVTATGSPPNGTAPLAASLGVEAAGGTGPYNLSVCVEGPFARPNGTGPCPPTASLTAWNGSVTTVPLALNASGNYTAVATVTDSNGATATASVEFDVAAPPSAAPLQVQASGHPSSSGLPGSYDFVATVQGGTAPYSVQWTFGDGSYGSSLPGGTLVHSYLASGTYTATLMVTDAHGTVRSSTVGPLLVTLPNSSGTSLLGGASLGIVAGSLAVILASLAVIVYVARTAAERRRTEAWLSSLDAGPPAEQPPSRPRP